MNKENIERAKALFEKDETVQTAYFTSDGNMFRAGHYASGWANGLSDQKVESVGRSLVMAADIIARKQAEKPGETEVIIVKSKEAKNTDTEERDKLVTRYIELFDTKPNHMTGVAKLKEKIAEKEAELKAAEAKEKGKEKAAETETAEENAEKQ